MSECFVCGSKNENTDYYKINNKDGFGLPEAWCCKKCMISAEDGSHVQKMRDSLYHKYFPEFEKIEAERIY